MNLKEFAQRIVLVLLEDGWAPTQAIKKAKEIAHDFDQEWNKSDRPSAW